MSDANVPNTSRPRATTSGLPPKSARSLPSSANQRPRQIGASRMSMPFVERLHRIGRDRGRHRDDRAGLQRCQQAVFTKHDRIDLIVVADAEDDEIAGRADLRRGACDGRAHLPDFRDVPGTDVMRRDRVAVFQEMFHHGLAHAADADDADLFLLRTRHAVLPFCHRIFCPYCVSAACRVTRPSAMSVASAAASRSCGSP
jgi:hypothetical protein